MHTQQHPLARTRATTALVIGESLVDIIHPADGGAPTELPGGSPMNASIGLARQGVDVQFVTELGADTRGDRIEARLAHEGVDILAPLRLGRTSVAHAQLRPDGAADYRFDLDWCLEAGMPAHSPVDVVHYGSLAAATPPGAAVVDAFVRDARRASTISYDPNIRAAHDLDADAARVRVERQARASDIVKASDEDLTHLYGAEADLDAIAADWIAAGVALVVITRAGDGMLLRTATERVDLPGQHVDIVDTIGAGDAVTAGLLAGLGILGLLGADRREHLRAIDARSLHAVGDWAQRTALLTLTRAGAEPPTSAETRDAHALIRAA